MELQTSTLHEETRASLFNFLNFVFLCYPITFRRNTAVRDYRTMIHYIKTESLSTRFFILSPLLLGICPAHSGSLVECTQYNGSDLLMARFEIHDNWKSRHRTLILLSHCCWTWSICLKLFHCRLKVFTFEPYSLSTLQWKVRRGEKKGEGKKSAFSESQLIQRESLRNRIRFLIFERNGELF